MNNLSMPWATLDQAEDGVKKMVIKATGGTVSNEELANGCVAVISYGASKGFSAEGVRIADHHNAIASAAALGGGVLSNMPWGQIIQIALQVLEALDK